MQRNLDRNILQVVVAGTSDLDGLGRGGRGGFPSGHAVRLGGSLRVASGVSRRYAPGVETLEFSMF